MASTYTVPVPGTRKNRASKYWRSSTESAFSRSPLMLRIHVERNRVSNEKRPAGSVGDASMSPYEISTPGGSVEHYNEEAGATWMERTTQTYPACVWLNPVPERHWSYTPSIQLLQQLSSNRMFPLTLGGLDSAMKELNK